jgi:hypothetical protein
VSDERALCASEAPNDEESKMMLRRSLALLVLIASCDRPASPSPESKKAEVEPTASKPHLDARFRDKALDFLAAVKNCKGPLASDVQLATLRPDTAEESPKTRQAVEEVRRAYNALPPSEKDAELAIKQKCIDVSMRISELGYAIAKARWDDPEGKQAREDLTKAMDGKQFDKLVQDLEQALARSE